MAVGCGIMLLLILLTIGVGAWRLLRAGAITRQQFWTITGAAVLFFLFIPLVVMGFLMLG